jgi:methylated-DNA-[protein]-cysteine S-methyltransferase
VWTVIDSPIGPLRLVAAAGRLTAIEFSPFRDDGRRPRGERDDADPTLTATAGQLAEYFAGERREFELPLAPAGTEFQQRVWACLRHIGWGATTSYGQIARDLGLTNAASRAVGSANGSNPIPIVIPCHRVVGADGSLTGYAGGLDRKRSLLDLEQETLFSPQL